MSEKEQEEPLHEPRFIPNTNPFRPLSDDHFFYIMGITQRYMWDLNGDSELPNPEDTVRFVEDFLGLKKEDIP